MTGSAGGVTNSDWNWWRDRRPPATRLHLDTAAAGRQTREALADLPGWAVTDPVDAPSAIVGLRAAGGQDVVAARARLLGEHGIVTTACTVLRPPWTWPSPRSASAPTSTSSPTT